jgi:hypothetical protein
MQAESGLDPEAAAKASREEALGSSAAVTCAKRGRFGTETVRNRARLRPATAVMAALSGDRLLVPMECDARPDQLDDSEGHAPERNP